MDKLKPYPKSNGVFYERELLESPAYRTLTKYEMQILNIFYLKRVFLSRKEADRLNLSRNYVKNNGDIKFTYAEAKGYGFSKATFVRALDKLVHVGLIDITLQGGTSQSSKYFISERWMNYGKSNMIVKERPKLTNQLIGFKTRKTKKET